MRRRSDTGVFVEPENPEDFAKEIFFYLNNPTLGKAQGENGYRYAKKYFNRAYLAEEYAGLSKFMFHK